MVWFLKCGVTFGILCFLFLKVPASEVITALLNIKSVYLLPVLLLQVFSRYVNACQLQIFTKKQEMNFSVLQLMKINFVSQFYGLFLPGELSASLVKWHKLAQKSKMGAEAVACILFSRVIRTLCLAILGMTFFLIEMPYPSIPVVTSLVISLALSLILYLFIISPGVFLRVEKGIRMLNFDKTPEWIRKKVHKVWSSIKCFHSLSSASLYKAVYLSFVFYLLDALSVYLIALALEIRVSIISIIWIKSAVTFIQMFPVSISGLGVREGAFVFLLKGYEVLASNAMALSFSLFGIAVIMALIGGILEASEFLSGEKSLKE